MSDELTIDSLCKVEAGLATLQLEVSELRANTLGPTSPFGLVLQEVGAVKKDVETLHGEVVDLRQVVDGHTTQLAEVKQIVNGHTVQLSAIEWLLLKIATKLDVANNPKPTP